MRKEILTNYVGVKRECRERKEEKNRCINCITRNCVVFLETYSLNEENQYFIVTLRRLKVENQLKIEIM